jgi:hypothetical protein
MHLRLSNCVVCLSYTSSEACARPAAIYTINALPERNVSRRRRARFAFTFKHEECDGRAPAAGFGRGVGEVFDEGRAREHRADGLALHADALAVDDAHAAEAFRRASRRYSSTTARTSRGGIEWRSNTSPISKAHRLRKRVEGVNVVRLFARFLNLRANSHACSASCEELSHQFEKSHG